MKNKVVLNIGDDILKQIEDNKHVIEEKEQKMARTANIGITSTDDVFIPEIHPDDDMFNRTIKEILIDKKISLKSLPFKDNQEQFNFKRSLRIHRTMSLQKFERWMDILGIEWSLHHDYKFKSKNNL